MSDWEENDRLYETNKKQYLNQPDLELKQSHFAAKILELVDVKVLVENQKKSNVQKISTQKVLILLLKHEKEDIRTQLMNFSSMANHSSSQPVNEKILFSCTKCQSIAHNSCSLPKQIEKIPQSQISQMKTKIKIECQKCFRQICDTKQKYNNS